MTILTVPTDVVLGDILVDEIVLLSPDSGTYAIPVKLSRRTNNFWAKRFADTYLRVKYSDPNVIKSFKLDILVADKPIMHKPILLKNEAYVYQVDDLYVSSGKILIKNTTIEHFTKVSRDLLDQTVKEVNDYYVNAKSQYVSEKELRHLNSSALKKQLEDIQSHVSGYLSTSGRELNTG